MRSNLQQAEVVIVGGGVSGLSSAFWLVSQGVNVAVIERGIVGWEASGRNGGMIAHRGDPRSDGLGKLSHELWPQMDGLLGYPTEFRSGRIDLALDESYMIELNRRRDLSAKVGFHLESIDAKTIRDLVPLASHNLIGGVYSAESGHANPQRTVQAFAWAVLDHGGRIYQNTTVTGFEVSGGKVTAVQTTQGSIGTDFVISAAGPQTSIIASYVGRFVPVASGRVEIIVTAPVERMWQGALCTRGLYGRQTERGNLAYGGGPQEWIDVGANSPKKPNTPLVRNVARRIAELYPGASDVPHIRSWAGVVEVTPDHLPIIDVLDEPENFFIVSGAGAGFGRSPGTGKAVADLVMHGESAIPIDGLKLSRFAGMSRNFREQAGWMPGANTIGTHGYHPSTGNYTP